MNVFRMTEARALKSVGIGPVCDECSKERKVLLFLAGKRKIEGIRNDYDRIVKREVGNGIEGRSAEAQGTSDK